MDKELCLYCNKEAVFAAYLRAQLYRARIDQDQSEMELLDEVTVGLDEPCGDVFYYCADHVPEG